MSSAAPASRTQVDVSELTSSRCNVCNVNATRDEVVLNFGVDGARNDSQAVAVKLLHRIVLSPHAAKRVSLLLSRVVRDFEARNGALN